MARRAFLTSLLSTLIALLALAVAADRVASFVAARIVAGHVKSAAHLSETPGVRIAGFPFFTQMASGRYQEIDVTARDVTTGPVRFDYVRADLFGVHVPLSKVTSGTLSNVPVDHGTGAVLLSFGELNTYGQSVTPRLTFSRDGQQLKVTGSVDIAGQTLSASGDAQIAAQGRAISIRPLPATITSPLGSIPSRFASPVERALSVSFQATGLPFGVSLQSATVTGSGLLFTATSQGFVIPTGAGTGGL